MTYAKVRSLIVGILVLALGITIGYQIGSGHKVPLNSSTIPSQIINAALPASHSTVDFAPFWNVWDRLQQSYYDPSKLKPQAMVDGAISGMVSSLGDPYTLYLPPAEQKRTSDDLNGSFDGVGIELGYKNQTLVVVSPLKGMPAEAAGVKAGDYILHIKDAAKNLDIDTAGLSLADAVSDIRGPKGSQVILTFLRDGGQPKAITLTRQTINVPSVDLSFIQRNGKNVAWLKLSQFGGNTEDEWNQAIAQIVAKKGQIKGVVLDVRNNPGGFLDEAVSVASEFIPNGLIVTQQGKSESIPYTINKKGQLTDIPLVVLINKGSASAAEIVSGALRDRKGTKLIGENSFGKGTVQDAQDLPNGGGLHITIAKWLTPSGEWIHGKGLKPTIAVPDDRDPSNPDKDSQLDTAINQL